MLRPMDSITVLDLEPLLVVRDAVRAIDFYKEALGATETARYVNKRLGTISHATLAADGVTFSVTEEARAWNCDAPPSLGGSPVVVQLKVGDVDTAFERMCAAGAAVVFGVVDFCGERMGRVRDPFGHLWLLSQRVEDLTVEEIQKRRDEWVPPGGSSKTSSTIVGGSARRQEPTREARMHLIIGPVGSGKSTFALALGRQHRAVRHCLDDWMASLFRADRPETGVVEWYVERAARCVDQIWKMSAQAIDSGHSVVLEIGLLRRSERERLYARVDAAGYALDVYVLDAPREVRWERVESRNREKGETFSMVVPRHVFEMASDMWEPPDETESRVRNVRRDG